MKCDSTDNTIADVNEMVYLTPALHMSIYLISVTLWHLNPVWWNTPSTSFVNFISFCKLKIGSTEI